MDFRRRICTFAGNLAILFKTLPSIHVYKLAARACCPRLTQESDKKGLDHLVVVVAQTIDTRGKLMQGFVSKDAIATTNSSQKATIYRQSQSTLWTKGKSFKNFINLHDIFLNCDNDYIIYFGKPDGLIAILDQKLAICLLIICIAFLQTKYNVFVVYTEFDHGRLKENKVSHILMQRKINSTTIVRPSWTKRLLLDESLEEANELCRALEDNKLQVVSEIANVLYHSMVLLALKGVRSKDVLEVLRQRFFFFPVRYR
ncbi:hypothetical protein CUMW_238410 [Citrus unshiu]|uniref:Phosphoribosyl-AMP cyclohydrolase domain-containing protein n=1 Tax=Citrus unshiu TaxID=55188 RepID=A0A2H5QKF7_CITUN|nr:hypothetical protein CUMW_238410 [Citrus unshiu]